MVVTSLGAFVFGLIFAVGLGIAGMTQPAKVLAFLDVTGRWDPTLAVVMGSAVTVGLFCFPRILARPRALSGTPIAVSTALAVDTPLLLGAGLFGVGWGLAGYCPGPAVVSLVTGTPAVITFVSAMIAGLYLGGRMRILTNSPASIRRGRPDGAPSAHRHGRGPHH